MHNKKRILVQFVCLCLLVPSVTYLSSETVSAVGQDDVTIPILLHGADDTCPSFVDIKKDSGVTEAWRDLYTVSKVKKSDQGGYLSYPDDNAQLNLNFYPQYYTYGTGCYRDSLDFVILVRPSLNPNWRFDNNWDGKIYGKDEDPLMLTKVEIKVKLNTPDSYVKVRGEFTAGWTNEYYGSYSYYDWGNPWYVDSYAWAGDSSIGTTQLVRDWYNDFRAQKKSWEEAEAKKEFCRDIMKKNTQFMKQIATVVPSPYTAAGAKASSWIEQITANTLFAKSDPPLQPDNEINDEIEDYEMKAVFEHDQKLTPQEWGHTAYTRGDYGLVGLFEIYRTTYPQRSTYEWEISAKAEFHQYWGGYKWIAEDTIVVTMDNDINHRFVKEGHGEDDPPVPSAKITQFVDEYPTNARYKVEFSAEDTIPGENVNELYYFWDFGYETNLVNGEGIDQVSSWVGSEKVVHYYPHDCPHDGANHIMCGSPFGVTLTVTDTRYVRSTEVLWIDNMAPPPPLPKADPKYGAPGLTSTISWDTVYDFGIGIDRYETALDQTVSWTDRGLATSFQVGPLASGDHIAYVRAVDKNDNTGDYGSVHIYVDTPPAPPTDLTCEFDSSSLNNVKLEWTLSLDDGQGENDIDRYDIYRSESVNGLYFKVGSVSAGTSSFIREGDGDVDTNSWYYTVMAVSIYGAAKEAPEKASKFVIPLKVGINFVSILPEPKDTTPAKVLEYTKTRYSGFDGVAYFDRFDNVVKKCFWKHPTMCTELTELTNTMGFWVAMKSPGDLVVTGSVETSFPPYFWLAPSWSQVGYPSHVERTVADALSGLDEYISVYEQNDGPCPDLPFAPCLREMEDTDIMKPGKGYDIKKLTWEMWSLNNEFEQISIEDGAEHSPPQTEDHPCLPEWWPGGHCKLRRFDLRSSGIDYSKYRIDGGSWVTYEDTVDVPEGYHTLEFYSTDKNGNVEVSGHSPYENYALVDDTPPDTELYFVEGDQGENGWYTSPLILTFYVNLVGGMGVVHVAGKEYTKYEIDGDGNWVDFVNPFSFDKQGFSSISYFSADVAGNVESHKQMQLKIDHNPPTVTPLAPLDGSSTQDLNPTFSWEGFDSTPGSGLSGYYRIQIAITPSFSSPVVNEEVQSTSHTPDLELSMGETYYWRVKALDSAGNWGEWSSSWSISIRAPPPTTTLLSPPDGEWTNDNTPTFEWEGNMQGPPGLSGVYRIQISFDSDFSSTIVDTEVTGTTYTPGSPLIDEWNYWHVKAKDNDEVWGDWSGTRVIVIDTVAPIPAGSFTAIVSDTPTNLNLEWDLSLDDGSGFDDVVGYKIYRSFTIDGPYSKIGEVDRQTSSWISIGDGMLDPNEYYYKVEAIDRAENVGTNDYTRAGKNRIQLYPGENFISIPLVQHNSSTVEVLKSITGGYTAVEWYSSSLNHYFVYKPSEDTWPYNLTELDHKIGFMINMTIMDTLVVAGAVPVRTGIRFSESTFRSFKFPGHEEFPHIFGGQNESEPDFSWIGLPSLFPIRVGELRNQIIFSQVKKFDAIQKVIVNLSDGDYMYPEEGYFINVTDIVDSLDNASFLEMMDGILIDGDLSSTYFNDGEYQSIKEQSRLEGSSLYVRLNVTYELPLSPGSDSWVFYVDAIISESYNDSFIFQYQDPQTLEWNDMLIMDPGWGDIDDGMLPSHQYEFPFGTFNSSQSTQQTAYIRILDNNSEECDPGTTNLSQDVISIDRMFIRSKSSYVWDIENLVSPVVFNSFNISLNMEYPSAGAVMNITATIHNSGEYDLKELVVSFLIFSDQDRFAVGMPIQDFEVVIPHVTVPAEGYCNVSFKWEVDGYFEIIRVTVDHNPSQSNGYLNEGYVILDDYGPVSF